MNIKKRWGVYRICLILILILSGFIYFYRLNKESLLTDEYLSLYVAQQPLKSIIFDHKKPTNPNTMPPLYEILMHFWLNIFGTNQFAQRSLSALFGILSVYVLYRLAELLFDKQTGLLSALFGSLSFSWFCLFRQNRCYSLSILLTLLSFYLFFYYLKNRDSRASFFSLIAVNILLTYTHYFSFLVILLEVIFVISQWKRYKQCARNILFMCLVTGIVYLPWYSNFFYDIKREPILLPRMGYSDIFDACKSLFSIIMVLFFDFHFRWEPVLSIFYIPLIIRGCIRLKKEGAGGFKHLLPYLIAIFALPFILVYSFTQSDRIRYYAIFYFPFSILLALGIQKLKMQGIRKFIYFPMFVFIACFNVLDFYDFLNCPLYENWRQAAQYIKDIPDYQNKEMVFVFQTKYNPPVFAYYFWQNKLSGLFVKNIATYENYENSISALGTKHKVCIIEEAGGKEFFDKIASFPDDAWIWVFRYHDTFFSSNFRALNNGRYFYHRIVLNNEIPQIDLYLLKKIK